MRPLSRALIVALLGGTGVARAAPSVVVEPPAVRPGDAFLVTVRGAPSLPSGTIADQPLAFFPDGRAFRAIAALRLETPPGRQVVEVSVSDAAGPAREIEADLAILEPRFPSRTLEVASRYVEPSPEEKERMEADRAAVAHAFDRPFGPPHFRRGFAWPRPRAMTGGFGEKRVFNGALQSQHYGVDLSGTIGAPVRAANDGEVALVRDCYASGRTVVVSHGAGIFSVYFHLSRILVREGAPVRRGDRLGLVGRSGRATGPHLHFGIRVAGLYVDPESVMRLPIGRQR